MAQNNKVALVTTPVQRRNPFRDFDLEAATKQFDEVNEHLTRTREELNIEKNDHASTRGLHKQDVQRLEEDYSRLKFKLDFLLEEHSTLERRCEFFRRKAEMLTGKFQLLSQAASSSYQQAMEDLYDEQTVSRAPLPEDEAAVATKDAADAADIISRLPKNEGEAQ